MSVGRGTVSNEPFRERYEYLQRLEGLTMQEVAERLGWVVRKESGTYRSETSRVGRLLGLRKDNGIYRENMSADNAEALCKALHIDPWEVGI